jgi:hypothetical protein
MGHIYEVFFHDLVFAVFCFLKRRKSSFVIFFDQTKITFLVFSISGDKIVFLKKCKTSIFVNKKLPTLEFKQSVQSTIKKLFEEQNT